MIQWEINQKILFKSNLEIGDIIQNRLMLMTNSLLGDAPSEFIVPSRKSIGYEILKRMTAKKEVEIPKVSARKKYGVQMPSGLIFGSSHTASSFQPPPSRIEEDKVEEQEIDYMQGIN